MRAARRPPPLTTASVRDLRHTTRRRTADRSAATASRWSAGMARDQLRSCPWSVRPRCTDANHCSVIIRNSGWTWHRHTGQGNIGRPRDNPPHAQTDRAKDFSLIPTRCCLTPPDLPTFFPGIKRQKSLPLRCLRSFQTNCRVVRPVGIERLAREEVRLQPRKKNPQTRPAGATSFAIR